MALNAYIVVATAFVVWPVSSIHSSAPGGALIDLLVWSAHLEVDATAYAPDVRRELRQVLVRSKRYRSTRRRWVNSPEAEMVYAGEVAYERRLIATSTDSNARAVAVAYATRLRPCYEREGFHDCPEREAVFADDYQSAHPGGPFSRYLPLLAAHRWLCAAEAYEYEQRPDDAARGRRKYEQLLATARAARSPLIRTAADELAARGRCFTGP